MRNEAESDNKDEIKTEDLPSFINLTGLKDKVEIEVEIETELET